MGGAGNQSAFPQPEPPPLATPPAAPETGRGGHPSSHTGDGVGEATPPATPETG